MRNSRGLGVILVAFGLLILAVAANWGEVLGPGPMAEREPLPRPLSDVPVVKD